MKDFLFTIFIITFMLFIICALGYAAYDLFGITGCICFCIITIFVISMVILNLIITNKEK